jgi:hypothetical protein
LSERLERAATISRASASGTSVALGWSLVNLAIAYRFLGQTDEVFRIATEAYDRMREALGEGHYSPVHALTLLGYVKAIRGEPDAEATARKVAVQAQLPADHYERAVGLTFLGFVLMHEHKLAEAQRVLEEVLRLRRNQFSSPNLADCRNRGLVRRGVCAARRPRAPRRCFRKALTRLRRCMDRTTRERARRRCDGIA